MFKRKHIILTYVLLFMVIGVACANEESQSKEVENDESDEEEHVDDQQEENDAADKAKDIELKPEEGYESYVMPDIDSEEFKEARAKLEELSEDEIKELIKKPAENDYQITDDFTEDDKLILNTLTTEEYYDLVGMTEDEVLNWIDVYHGKVNTYINYAHQKGGVDSDEYKEYRKDTMTGTKEEFEWIRDNYKFDKEYHNEAIKEIVKLIDAHAEGNSDALFSLKYILYELNQELNPESLEEGKANDLTLYNAVRIQNGENPLDKYE